LGYNPDQYNSWLGCFRSFEAVPVSDRRESRIQHSRIKKSITASGDIDCQILRSKC
jgi:hypothetical protein